MQNNGASSAAPKPDPRQPPPATSPELFRSYPAETIAEGAQVVEVMWGKEYWQPIQFHGVEVGPFRVMGAVRKGETEMQATARIYAELEEFAKGVRKKKLTEYLDTLRLVQDGVAARAVR